MLKLLVWWAVVVAQLVEQLLPTPDIRGSNPDIGKILSTNCTLEKTKIKKKRPGMAYLQKSYLYAHLVTDLGHYSSLICIMSKLPHEYRW